MLSRLGAMAASKAASASALADAALASAAAETAATAASAAALAAAADCGSVSLIKDDPPSDWALESGYSLAGAASNLLNMERIACAAMSAAISLAAASAGEAKELTPRCEAAAATAAAVAAAESLGDPELLYPSWDSSN